MYNLIWELAHRGMLPVPRMDVRWQRCVWKVNHDVVRKLAMILIVGAHHSVLVDNLYNCANGTIV